MGSSCAKWLRHHSRFQSTGWPKLYSQQARARLKACSPLTRAKSRVVHSIGILGWLKKLGRGRGGRCRAGSLGIGGGIGVHGWGGCTPSHNTAPLKHAAWGSAAWGFAAGFRPKPGRFSNSSVATFPTRWAFSHFCKGRCEKHGYNSDNRNHSIGLRLAAADCYEKGAAWVIMKMKFGFAGFKVFALLVVAACGESFSSEDAGTRGVPISPVIDVSTPIAPSTALAPEATTPETTVRQRVSGPPTKFRHR